MKKISIYNLFLIFFTLLISGVAKAEQSSNLANLQQGVIIAPCMYALLNGETVPQAYHIVMEQQGSDLTFTVDSVELAKEGECNDYTAPIQEAGKLDLDADSIIPIGCEDINNSIADAIKNAMSDSENEQSDLVSSILSTTLDNSLEEASYTCESISD